MPVDAVRYPRTAKLLAETHWTLDQAYIWTEVEIKKVEEKESEDHGKQ